MAVLTISVKASTCGTCNKTVREGVPVIKHSARGWIHADCFGGQTGDLGGNAVYLARRIRALVDEGDEPTITALESTRFPLWYLWGPGDKPSYLTGD